MWTFRTIILPIELADTARNLCMALAGSASEGMFTTPLYTGDVHTHAISSGYIATEFSEVLPCGGEGGDVDGLVAMLAGVGTEVTIEELSGLMAMIDISDEDAQAALDRLGLGLVQKEGEA